MGELNRNSWADHPGIRTYDVVRADYDKVYDEFTVAEREYNQWKETAQFPLVQFIPDGTVDAVEGYDYGIKIMEPFYKETRTHLARIFSGQELKSAIAKVDKQEQVACDLLDAECKAIESLPVVANYNRLRDKENAALGVLVDAQCAVIGYPMRTMADVHVKAQWLKANYRDNQRSDFTENEQEALLQSFFDLG